MKTGITGGIGSGKSYVCRRLAQRGIQVYDSDSAAKWLIRTSTDIRQRLTALIGPETYVDGQLNKAAVSRFLLSSEANAHAIDAIVHPAVFRDFEESGMEWLESAILYESGMEKLVDRVIVVTAPEEVRIGRIIQRDGISREKALQWLERQWPQEKIIARADCQIVNDGTADIDSQIDSILSDISNSPN